MPEFGGERCGGAYLMPRLIPNWRRLELEDEGFIKRLRHRYGCFHGRVHRDTGGFSIWAKEPRLAGKRWRQATMIKSLPPSCPRSVIEQWCEAFGCPPPWVPKGERKAWRDEWGQRNGVPPKPKVHPLARAVDRGHRWKEEGRQSKISNVGHGIENFCGDGLVYDDEEEDEDLDRE